MQQQRLLRSLIASAATLIAADAALAQTAAVCRSVAGSPTICLRFDDAGQTQDEPRLDIDFTVDFSDLANPDIELLTGTDATITRN